MTGCRAAAVLALTIAALGCSSQRTQRGYEYMPDMTASVPYDTFARNRVTRSGMTQQVPVRGTIPRGFLPIHYANTPADAARAGRELSFPQPPDTKTVEQGKQLYETFAVPAAGAPLFQAATANLNPWTEVKVDTDNADREPLLLISGEKDHTVPWTITNASFKQQKDNPGITEIVEIPGRGHAVTIDSGWHEVADKALAFIQRFV